VFNNATVHKCFEIKLAQYIVITHTAVTTDMTVCKISANETQINPYIGLRL